MSLLPKKKTIASTELADYSILILGDKKVGKTRLASFIPDVLMIPLEAASTGRPMYKAKPKNWKQLRKLARELEETSPDKFPAVCVDTVDVAWQYCADYVCDKLGIEQLGTTYKGKRDFGYSHGICKQDFLKELLRIKNTGRTLVLIAHTKLRTITTLEGDEYQKIMPSFPPSCLDVIKPLTEMNFMLDYARYDGKKQRIILTQGDSRYFAGCGDPAVFPEIVPLLHCFDKKQKADAPELYDGKEFASPWKLVEAAFKGEVAGLDPARVDISLDSGAITTDTIEELASRKSRKGEKAKKKVKKSKKSAKVAGGKKTVARKRK